MNRALRAATVGVLLLSPVVLSACSAGQITQTGTQVRDKTGAEAQVGNIAIRAAKLAYPTNGTYARGDNAGLQMAIVNDGSSDDALVRVSGTGFSGAVFTDATAAASTSSTPSGTTVAGSTSASPTGSPTTSTSSTGASPTGTPTGTATATGAPTSASPTGTPAPTDIPIPAGGTVFVGTDDTHVTLTGLESPLMTGQYITLVLTFQKAGEVTMKVTVANPPITLDRGQTFDFNQGGE
ncbi:MAG: copper chaperone PCu(A)C [Blastococcus sp.]